MGENGILRSRVVNKKCFFIGWKRDEMEYGPGGWGDASCFEAFRDEILDVVFPVGSWRRGLTAVKIWKTISMIKKNRYNFKESVRTCVQQEHLKTLSSDSTSQGRLFEKSIEGSNLKGHPESTLNGSK